MLKKSAAIFICFFSFISNAQEEKPITKGNWIIDGNVTAFYKKQLNHLNYSFSLSPKACYFIWNGLAVGLAPSFSYDYTHYNSNISNSFKVRTHSYGIGPIIKYYFKKGLLLSVAGSYLRTETKDGNDLKSRSNGLSLTPGIGFAFFLNNKVALEPMISYVYLKDSRTHQYTLFPTYSGYNSPVYTSTNTQESSKIMLSLSLSIFL